MILASWTDVVAAAPGSFLLGVGVGWIVSQRYAVVRRSDEPGANRRQHDKRGSDE